MKMWAGRVQRFINTCMSVATVPHNGPVAPRSRARSPGAPAGRDGQVGRVGRPDPFLHVRFPAGRPAGRRLELPRSRSAVRRMSEKDLKSPSI